MFSSLFLTVLVVSASAWEAVHPRFQMDFNPQEVYLDDGYGQHLYQKVNKRQTRQVHGSATLNSDGTTGISASLPFTSNNRNVLSAIGGANFDAAKHLQSASAGVAFENVNNGLGLSLMKSHIPDFGSRFTSAGHANIFHNLNHDVNANAYFIKNMPSNPQVPNFNTVGAGLDYMYKNKIGASLGVAHTPYFQRTDYSATGNLNLFRDRSTSLDFNAGLSKSVSPFMQSSSWQPSTGFTLKKIF